jgi:ABC-type transport system involved in multi-copper enzyme maturation permease subunit
VELITRLKTHLGLPLLAKELIEQAARKRTYIVRVAYAVLLFFVAFLFFYETLAASRGSPLAVLGRGRDLFMVLVQLQFAGIYLFMPAITCGVVTSEKERNSLQLLFLTRLGPWTILFEKLLGRLVPMSSFVLLSLPLLGFAYSLGGISPRLLWTGVWMLFLAAILMGTLALACSSFFRTTVGAFMASYVIAFIMFFGPYMTWMVLYLIAHLLEIDPDRIVNALSSNMSVDAFLVFGFPFFAPPYYLVFLGGGGPGFWGVFGHTTVVLATSSVFLLVARRCLVARAFVASRNYLLEFLKVFDRRGSRRTAIPAAHAPVTHTDLVLLPNEQPIAWRETNKRSLGRARYLVRLLLFVEVPLVLFCGFLVFLNWIARLRPDRYQFEMMPRVLVSMMILMLWALAVLVVAVQSASLIAGERTHQTLEVLCTAPIRGRDIVLQKLRGVWRLIGVLSVPFFTLFLCEAWLRGVEPRQNWRPPDEFSSSGYLLSSVLTVAIYLPLVAWLSLAIGLKFRTQARAMIGAMAAIVAWAVGPFLFCVMPLAIASRGSPDDGPVTCLMLLSPTTVIFWNEIEFNFLHRVFGDFIWLPFVLNFAGYGAAIMFFRQMCLANADRWLGRLETNLGPLAALRSWVGAAAGEETVEDGG